MYAARQAMETTTTAAKKKRKIIDKSRCNEIEM